MTVQAARARFTLDETRARAWLRAAVEAYPDGMRGGTRNPDTGEKLPEIGADWSPRDFDEECNVDAVVRIACEEGIVVQPDQTELYFEYAADPDGGHYQFFVYAGPHLKLASPCIEMRHVGTPDTTGIAAGMDILREAVQSANGVLEALDKYIAARQ